MGGGLDRGARLHLLFGLVSLAAVGLGAYVCALNGASTGSWIRNLVAWGVGAIGAAALSFAPGRGARLAALWLAPLALAASFFNPDQEGVRRWIDIGPVHANVAMLVLPAAAVSLAVLATERLWPWVLVLLCLGLTIAQPDASQATTLGAVALLVATASVRWPNMRWAIAAAAVVLAVVAWTRPDPLQPVPEVEGVVGLAFAASPLLGALAVLLLVAVVVTPGLASRGAATDARLAGWALSLCFAAWAVTPLLGAFPVPFLGLGMSPIVGGWLGAGMLAGLLPRQGPATP